MQETVTDDKSLITSFSVWHICAGIKIKFDDCVTDGSDLKVITITSRFLESPLLEHLSCKGIHTPITARQNTIDSKSNLPSSAARFALLLTTKCKINKTS